jgi:ABC-2 type transport system permease protein
VIGEFKRAFDVAVIPHFSSVLPGKLDVLVVIDAAILQRDMLYAIDQHVMGGGGLIVLIDPRLHMGSGSDRVSAQPSEAVDDISDLLLHWGARYVSGEVVGDEAFAAPVMDSRQHQLAFPFWLRIGDEGLVRTHPVTGAINELLFVEPGAFELTMPERASALVTTTARSGALPASAFATKVPEELARAFKSDGRQRALAVALKGPFTSAFPKPIEGAAADRHRARSTGEPAVFAVADVDWVFDAFSFQSAETSGGQAMRPLNDNAALLLNMIDFASGDPTLIAIRSRGRLARPFTRVATLLREGQQRYRNEEADIAGRIAKVEQQIAKVPEAAGVARIEQLPDEIQNRIRQLERDLVPQRKRLRELRLGMREGVETLGVRLTIVNLLAGPVLVCAFALLMRRLRRRPLIDVKAGPTES